MAQHAFAEQATKETNWVDMTAWESQGLKLSIQYGETTGLYRHEVSDSCATKTEYRKAVEDPTKILDGDMHRVDFYQSGDTLRELAKGFGVTLGLK